MILREANLGLGTSRFDSKFKTKHFPKSILKNT